MQFSAVPLNLINRKAANKASFVLTGNWAVKASKEAARYGTSINLASSEDRNFSYIPDYDIGLLIKTARTCTSRATTPYSEHAGTAFQKQVMYPGRRHDVGISLEKLDINQFGLIFAGLQKNLGPAGLALVIIREDLLDCALPTTPGLLNYQVYAEQHSLANTTNTFAIYLMSLVLQWLKDQGGVELIEAQNEAKAKLIYDAIDGSDFYYGTADAAHRSVMNVTFNLHKEDLLGEFVKQAEAADLYALKGHRAVGGARASIYNAMPRAGCEALVEFMSDFERRMG